MIRIDESKCVKCHACVRDCVVHVLLQDEKGFPAVRPEDERFCLNCQHCLAVCPTGAVECHGVSAEACAPNGKLPSSKEMLNLLAQRRSIRQYRDENVSDDKIDAMLASLAWTPTGCNVHNLFFAVVRHKEKMEFFRSKMSDSLKMLIRTGLMRLVYPNFWRYMDEIMGGVDVIFRNAPHMIVAASPKDAPCKEADPWIGLSYLDLLAQSLGIGTCWSGFAVHAFKWMPSLRKRLGLPRGHEVRAVLLFGYPNVEYKRQTAPKQFQINVL